MNEYASIDIKSNKTNYTFVLPDILVNKTVSLNYSTSFVKKPSQLIQRDYNKFEVDGCVSFRGQLRFYAWNGIYKSEMIKLKVRFECTATEESNTGKSDARK